MKYLIYKIKYKQFFFNPEGINAFAERCINFYVRRAAAKKAQLLTSHIKVLKEEFIERSRDFEECSTLDRMDTGSFALKKSKSKFMKILVYVLVVFEIFLNYLSTLIFLQGDSFLLILARWAIAIGLTIITMIVVDRLLTSLLAEESVRVKGVGSKNDDEEYNQISKAKRLISMVILSIALVALQVTIVGVARQRALDIEGGKGEGILYYGFILFSMVLPVIAGYFNWDAEQHGRLYKNTERYFKIKNTIHTLNLSISATMKDVKDIVERSSLKAWAVLQQFKLYKENYNAKHNIPKENIEFHYCRNYPLFFNEALRLFGSDVEAVLMELKQAKK